MIRIKTVRDRAAHYLSPDVAAAAGLTLQDLQQFVIGSVTLQQPQLVQLAARMGFSAEQIAELGDR